MKSRSSRRSSRGKRRPKKEEDPDVPTDAWEVERHVGRSDLLGCVLHLSAVGRFHDFVRTCSHESVPPWTLVLDAHEYLHHEFRLIWKICQGSRHYESIDCGVKAVRGRTSLVLPHSHHVTFPVLGHFRRACSSFLVVLETYGHIPRQEVRAARDQSGLVLEPDIMGVEAGGSQAHEGPSRTRKKNIS